MTQQLKTFAANPGGQSLGARAHTEGKGLIFACLLILTGVLWHTCPYTRTMRPSHDSNNSILFVCLLFVCYLMLFFCFDC